ncbi:hypothetical protein BC567DRAFT_217166 [Phyllosticta citribraziliensis]
MLTPYMIDFLIQSSTEACGWWWAGWAKPVQAVMGCGVQAIEAYVRRIKGLRQGLSCRRGAGIDQSQRAVVSLAESTIEIGVLVSRKARFKQGLPFGGDRGGKAFWKT